MVEKVLFSTSSGGRPRAVGIEVSTGPDSPRFRVSAAREVILCGGAIGTPQVLLLSGVGPADELVELDIPVVKELQAVGRNLVDVSAVVVIRTWRFLTLVFSMSRVARWHFERSRARHTVISLTRYPGSSPCSSG